MRRYTTGYAQELPDTLRNYRIRSGPPPDTLRLGVFGAALDTLRSRKIVCLGVFRFDFVVFVVRLENKRKT